MVPIFACCQGRVGLCAASALVVLQPVFVCMAGGPAGNRDSVSHCGSKAANAHYSKHQHNHIDDVNRGSLLQSTTPGTAQARPTNTEQSQCKTGCEQPILHGHQWGGADQGVSQVELSKAPHVVAQAGHDCLLLPSTNRPLCQIQCFYTCKATVHDVLAGTGRHLHKQLESESAIQLKSDNATHVNYSADPSPTFQQILSQFVEFAHDTA